MNTVSCIIVDDDPLASRVLQSLINRTEFLALEGVYNDSTQAFALLRQKNIELLFLDIEMPKMTGIEFIETLEKSPQIILVSAKKDYVEDAFEKDVADYLVKPVKSYPRFLKAVNKAIKRINNTNASHSQTKKLFIKVDSLLQSFQFSDILWIQAYGDFIKLYTLDKVHVVLGTLKTILSKLPSAEFAQIHRSYIVRLDKIQNIDQYNLQVAKKILPISKSFKQKLMNRINTL